MNRAGILLFVGLGLFLCIMAAKPHVSIENYAPENGNQKAIKDLLIRYQNARNRFDENQFLSCLHPGGIFAFKGEYDLPKAQLAGSLHLFWQRIRAKDQTVYPLVRESITGDFFDTWAFQNPQFTIDGDRARATVTCVQSWICRQRYFLSMRKEKEQWLIEKSQWEHF